jgi:hypothetical protein
MSLYFITLPFVLKIAHNRVAYILSLSYQLLIFLMAKLQEVNILYLLQCNLKVSETPENAGKVNN